MWNITVNVGVYGLLYNNVRLVRQIDALLGPTTSCERQDLCFHSTASKESYIDLSLLDALSTGNGVLTIENKDCDQNASLYEFPTNSAGTI